MSAVTRDRIAMLKSVGAIGGILCFVWRGETKLRDTRKPTSALERSKITQSLWKRKSGRGRLIFCKNERRSAILVFIGWNLFSTTSTLTMIGEYHLATAGRSDQEFLHIPEPLPGCQLATDGTLLGCASIDINACCLYKQQARVDLIQRREYVEN
jgi:hypothetical protein